MDDTIAAGTDTTLRLRHRFEAAPERVFAAWTRPDALKLWWCPDGWYPTRIEVDLRLGGKYRLSMTRQNGAQSVAVHGSFLEIEPARRLVYTWRWDGAFAEMPETTVTAEFNSVAGGTELSLRQEALAMPFCVQHVSGWTAALNRMTRIIRPPILQIRAADAAATEPWRCDCH
jgi:uncharacterized protein YndB with AHSA1/START domain